VKFADLLALVDFMYKGEVSMEDGELTSFIETAELLEVKGLSPSNNSGDKPKEMVKNSKFLFYLICKLNTLIQLYQRCISLN